MKKILLSLLVVLVFTQISFAQVGIGTDTPNRSSQLEVVSSDRGILIPRLALGSTTDRVAITNGNVNSLLVFNTAEVNDITPGYYYWYVDKWHKIATSSEIFAETITTLIDNGNGVFVYTSEDGTETEIDVPTSVVQNIIDEGDVYNEIINLIDANETVTIIQDNGDGTYTYYNESDIDADGNIIGVGVTIDVVGSIVQNIIDEGDVYNQIIHILEAESDKLVDLGNGKYKHIAADGIEVEFDINTVNVEKVTDADGNISYIFKDADNNPITTIEVTNDVLENIVNQGDIYNEIINILEAESDELVDLGNGKYKHIAADGIEVEFDINTVNVEKVTDADGNISYIFKDADGNSITEIEVTNDVLENIVNQGDIYNEIINILEAESDELVDLGNGKYKHIAADGTELEFDVNSVNVEKVTDADGNISYIFKDADGTAITTIEVTNDVLENIVNQGDIYNEIINILEAESDELVDLGNGKFQHTAADGEVVVFDINTVNVEKVTDADGNISYIFKDADGTAITTIEVTNDVLENIVNQGDIYNEIINILEAESDELVDLGNGKFQHTAADGEVVVFDINTVNVEKVTDADGNISYIFKDADGTAITTIEVTNDVLENIVNQGDIYNEIINILEAESDELVDLGNGKFQHTAADGEVVVFDINTVNVEKVTDADGNISYIFKDADGNSITEIEVTNDVLENIVNKGDIYNEIINILEAESDELVDLGNGKYKHIAADGTEVEFDINTVNVEKVTDADGNISYVFKDADGTAITTIEVTNDVLENIVNQGDIYNEIINILEAESDELVDLGNGKFQHTAADGEVVVFDINTVNVEKVTDADGNISYIFKDADNNPITTIEVTNDVLENIVNQGDIYNEIINILEAESDELVDLGNGKFQHTAADGEVVVFDINTVNVEKVTDADGNISYIFKDADNNPITTIAVTNDVLENIVNKGDIYNEIINILEAESDVLVDLGNGKFQHTAADGEVVVFDINTVNVEKVTDADGNISYIFKDADGTAITTIEVTNDVLENIVNQGDIYNEIINILEAESDELVDLGNGKFQHTAADGEVVVFDINTVNVEKVTDADGNISYIFKDADGTAITTIEVTNDVIENIVNQGDIYNEIINILEAESDELVDLGNGKFQHTAADGEVVVFDINTVNVEKVTDADGNISYIFKDADGTAITTIEVTNDVLENIVNQGDIYNEIINILEAESDELVDLGNGKFQHTAADGEVVVFDINTVNVEKVTDADGNISYIFKDADGNSITEIEVTNDVLENIVNQGDIYNEIINILEAESDELVDLGNGKYKHIAADGTEVEFDINTVNVEKVTDADGNISYIFKDADGTAITTIEVTNDVLENIVNQGDIYNEIINIIDLNETVTTLVDNGDGTFTYYNEDEIDADGNPIAGATGTSFDVTQSAAGNPNTNGTTGKAGDIYVDESNGDIYTFDGTEWVLVGSDNIKTGEGNPNDNSTDGKKGDIYIDESTGDTYIYNEVTGEWDIQGEDLTLDATLLTFLEGDGKNVLLKGAKLGIQAGADNSVMITDENGDVIWVDQVALQTTADNGLTQTDNNIKLGGDLLEDTYINLNENDKTLNIIGTNQRAIFNQNLFHIQGIGDSNASLRVSASGGSTLNIQSFKDNYTQMYVTGNSTALSLGTRNTTESAPITFVTSPGNGQENTEKVRITGEGDIGIGTTSPSQKLDVAEGNVRIRKINENVGEDINRIVVADSEGVLKTVKSFANSAPRFFYMPAVIFDTQVTGTATRDLYQEYVNQFTGGQVGPGNASYPISHGPAGTTPISYGGGIVGSAGAPADIAVFESDELYYYVTYYDEEVFDNLSISADGKLTYTVKAGATPSSYMNIVFVIKD